jgi:hypothetical protein
MLAQEAVDPQGDSVAAHHGERALLGEVVLHVDDEQCLCS